MTLYSGGAGEERDFWRDGDDVISGGIGQDTGLWAGNGNDTCVHMVNRLMLESEYCIFRRW